MYVQSSTTRTIHHTKGRGHLSGKLDRRFCIPGTLYFVVVIAALFKRETSAHLSLNTLQMTLSKSRIIGA